MRELKIYKQFFTKADCYKKGTKQQPTGVQVHSTGANNPYLKRYVQPDDGRLGKNPNNNSHNRSGIDVCANAYIGKLTDGTPAIYQTLPWNYRCWLSGSSTNGNANRLGYIGFEICEDNLNNKDYFESAVMGLSVNLVAYLCLQYNIPLGKVRDHKELHGMGLASNHADILHWLKRYGLTMDDYRAAVQQAINDGIQVTYVEGANEEEEIIKPMDVLYTAKVFATNGYPVKMRENPNMNAKILAYVPLDTIVDIYANKDGWSQILYSGQIGYMMNSFLQKQENIKPDIPQPPSTDIIVTREELEQLQEQLKSALAIVERLLANESSL